MRPKGPGVGWSGATPPRFVDIDVPTVPREVGLAGVASDVKQSPTVTGGDVGSLSEPVLRSEPTPTSSVTTSRPISQGFLLSEPSV